MSYLTLDEVKLATIGGPPYLLANYHSPDWWKLIKNHNLPKPVKIKFDDKIRSNMSSNLKVAKGIYMFFLETTHSFPPDIYMRHILYVGRVIEGASGHNFHKRMYHYVKDIGNKKAARNRMRLANLWPDNTYVYFFDLSKRDDKDIKDIETNIYNHIVPPLNEELHGESRMTRKLY
ncbi:hypothetical protein [Tenacibaculum aestuarii]|uniref:hypothetical protein n=1 Tax=Tenacibaculum aestuarii TaxID=362781 RepID=UPI0038939DBF